MKELGDRGAQGRACGNLGNTYYLLGDFEAAIEHHQVNKQIIFLSQMSDVNKIS